MSPAHAAAIPDPTASELIEAAVRKRRGARQPGTSAPVAPSGRRADPAPTTLEAGDEPVLAVGRRAGRRRVLADPPAPAQPEGGGAGLVTRGVHAGLDGLVMGRNSMRTLGLWGVSAAAMVALVGVLSGYALSQAPEPMPVTGMRVSFLPGPRLPQHEIDAWLSRFPYLDNLRDATPWVLEQLADYLRSEAAVAEVRQVSVVHEPSGAHGDHLQRILELVLRLRQPVLPVVLASGERRWVDADGWLLPGTLPGPVVRRPILRNIEWGGVDGVRAALALWRVLEPQIESGLVTEINLYEPLEGKDSQRGIVLHTRPGTLLIWGRPGEERYGVPVAEKARDLIRTLRCQGDLARVAMINVRFHQPYFVLRDAQH